MGSRPKANRWKGVPLSEIFYGPSANRVVAEQWFPAMDLCESEEEVIIRLEVPGVLAADLGVTVVGRTVKVEGIKREPDFADQEKIRFLCLERGYGPFQKLVELEWVVDPRRTTAVLRNGVLIIRLPKIPERRGAPLEIPIRGSDQN